MLLRKQIRNNQKNGKRMKDPLKLQIKNAVANWGVVWRRCVNAGNRGFHVVSYSVVVGL
jgi:hypothetical protein